MLEEEEGPSHILMNPRAVNAVLENEVGRRLGIRGPAPD
jgi:hypothetical protein